MALQSLKIPLYELLLWVAMLAQANERVGLVRLGYV